MEQLLSIVENFIQDRPVIRDHNSCPQHMHQLLLNEIDEYFEEEDSEKKARELADIMWFVMSMAILTGVDIEFELRDKAAKNHLKRNAVLYQSGDYDQIDAYVRRKAKEERLDEQYYNT